MALLVYCEINRKYFFLSLVVKTEFFFVNEVHAVFIEEQLTPDGFPVAKIPFVSDNVISRFEMPGWFPLMGA